MKPYKFHPKALREIDDAVSFYENSRIGLGHRFLKALEDTISKIRKSPLIYGKIYRDVRKCRLHRFPYGVIFRDRADYFEIISVMHFKRQPDYWKDRVQ